MNNAIVQKNIINKSYGSNLNLSERLSHTTQSSGIGSFHNNLPFQKTKSKSSYNLAEPNEPYMSRCFKPISTSNLSAFTYSQLDKKNEQDMYNSAAEMANKKQLKSDSQCNDDEEFDKEIESIHEQGNLFMPTKLSQYFR